MNDPLTITEEVAARLDAKLKEDNPFFGFAADVAEVDRQGKGIARSPSIFIISNRDKALPNQLTGIKQQTIIETITLVCALKGSKLKPGSNVDDVARLRKRIVGALLGFSPASTSSEFQYLSGETYPSQPGQSRFLLHFSIKSTIQGDPS